MTQPKHKPSREPMTALLTALGCGLMVLVFTPTSFAHGPPPPSLVEDQPAYPNVIHLDQAWSAADRLRYYFLPQGSAAMSYDIFLHLEAAGDQGLFRADQNLSRYGLVPHPADPKYNPDGLPIGVTKTVVRDGRWKGDWVGLGCAACHNGQIEYKGNKLSISGGNNAHLDLYAFLQGLDEALSATVADPQKFARLAESWRIGPKDELRRASGLRRGGGPRLREPDCCDPQRRGSGAHGRLEPDPQPCAIPLLGIPENWAASLAPAKSSFVWNIPQSAWAQWTGVRNIPIPRNLSEVLGVFTKMDLTSKAPVLRWIVRIHG